MICNRLRTIAWFTMAMIFLSEVHLLGTCVGVLLAQCLTGWWFGILFLFFHSFGNFIIPTDEVIFFIGVGIPPTRYEVGYFYPMFSPTISP